MLAGHLQTASSQQCIAPVLIGRCSSTCSPAAWRNQWLRRVGPAVLPLMAQLHTLDAPTAMGTGVQAHRLPVYYSSNGSHTSSEHAGGSSSSSRHSAAGGADVLQASAQAPRPAGAPPVELAPPSSSVPVSAAVGSNGRHPTGRSTQPRLPSSSQRGAIYRAVKVSEVDVMVAITASRTWKDLQTLLDTFSGMFSTRHLAAALCQLARIRARVQLLRSERAAAQKLALQLAGLFGARMGSAAPNDLAGAGWATAKLGLGPQWIKPWQDACFRQLGQSEARHVSMCLWALATWRQQLRGAEVATWLAAAEDSLVAATPQGCSNCIWALATLEVAVPETWLAAFYAATQHRLTNFSAQNLANTAWALARFNAAPPAAWTEAFWSAFLQQLESASPQALSNTAWALAKLGITPDEGWTAAFLAAAGTRLQSCSAQQLANTVWALGRWRCNPSDEWWGQLWLSVLGLGQELEPEGLCGLLWALAALEQRPSERWLALLEQQSYDMMSLLAPQGLALLAWAFGRLRHEPKRLWAVRFISRAGARMGSFTPQGLAMVSWGVSRMQLDTPPEWREQLLEACGLQVRAALQAAGIPAVSGAEAVPGTPGAPEQPQGTSSQQHQHQETSCDEASRHSTTGDSSSAQLHQQPAAAHAQPLPSSNTPSGRRRGSSNADTIVPAAAMKPQELVMLLISLPRLRARPSPEWLANAQVLSLHSLPSYDAKHLCLCMYGLARCGAAVEGSFVAAACERAGQLLPSFRGGDCAMFLWALAVLEPSTGWDEDALPSAWLQRYLDACQQHLPSMQHQELGQLAWALGRLQHRPAPTWLQVLLAASQPQLGSMPLLSTASLLWAVRQLEYVPDAAWMAAAVRAARRGVVEAQEAHTNLLLQQRCIRRIHDTLAWYQQALEPQGVRQQGLLQLASSEMVAAAAAGAAAAAAAAAAGMM